MTDWTLHRGCDLPILADGWGRLAVQITDTTWYSGEWYSGEMSDLITRH